MATGSKPSAAAGANLFTAVKDTLTFYKCFLYFLSGGSYKRCTYFSGRLQVSVFLPKLCLEREPPRLSCIKVPKGVDISVSNADVSPSHVQQQCYVMLKIVASRGWIIYTHTALTFSRYQEHFS